MLHFLWACKKPVKTFKYENFVVKYYRYYVIFQPINLPQYQWAEINQYVEGNWYVVLLEYVTWVPGHIFY